MCSLLKSVPRGLEKNVFLLLLGGALCVRLLELVGLT